MSAYTTPIRCYVQQPSGEHTRWSVKRALDDLDVTEPMTRAEKRRRVERMLGQGQLCNEARGKHGVEPSVMLHGKRATGWATYIFVGGRER